MSFMFCASVIRSNPSSVLFIFPFIYLKYLGLLEVLTCNCDKSCIKFSNFLSLLKLVITASTNVFSLFS